MFVICTNFLTDSLFLRDMPLTQLEMDEADDLFVSLAFGAGQEREWAEDALCRWAGANIERLDYLKKHNVVDRLIDNHLGELRVRYARPMNNSSNARRRAWRSTCTKFTYMLMGLACAVAAAVSYVNPILSKQEFHAAVGEQANVQLSDGSHVLLNTASSVVFEDRLRSREVTLVEGEVMLSVVHSELRPFEVVANTANIRDTGTVFSVRRNEHTVSVAVLEGQVQISVPAGGQPFVLGAERAAIVSDGQILPISDGPTFETLISWKDQRLEFTSEPLVSLVQEVQRYRKPKIRFSDRTAEAFRVTGGFSSADPDLLLKTLPDVVPVNVQFSPDGEVVISSRR